MRVALLPSQLIARDAAGDKHAFTLAVRWDGDIRVVQGRTASRWPGQGTVVAIAPERCLRRRLRIQPQTQAEMRALAADLFPFDLADAQLALHHHPDGLDVCVLAEEDKVAVAGATVALVAASSPSALTTALQQRISHGAVFDFQPAPARLISPSPLFTTAHVLLLTVTLGGGLWLSVMGQSAQERALRAEALRLQEEALPLSQRRQVTAEMVRSVEELARFGQRPHAAATAELSRVVANVPSGTLVDKISLKSGKLTVSGLGNEALDWLERIGIAENEVQITDLPKIDRFTVTRSLDTP